MKSLVIALSVFTAHAAFANPRTISCKEVSCTPTQPDGGTFASGSCRVEKDTSFTLRLTDEEVDSRNKKATITETIGGTEFAPVAGAYFIGTNGDVNFFAQNGRLQAYAPLNNNGMIKIDFSDSFIAFGILEVKCAELNQ